MLLSPFQDFIDRVEAFTIQLNTTLDAVRTYLSIQQQEQNARLLERMEKLGEMQAKVLDVIGHHEDLLKRLTWLILPFTVVLGVLHILP